MVGLHSFILVDLSSLLAKSVMKMASTSASAPLLDDDNLLLSSLASMPVLNVKPCTLDTVGKKNGASFGFFGGSFGLFRCFFTVQIQIT